MLNTARIEKKDENYWDKITGKLRRLNFLANQPKAYPLSNSQLGIWLHQYQFKNSVAYNLAYGFEFKFVIDENKLRSALAELVTRHPILHTRIDLVDGKPQQAIHPSPFYLDVCEEENTSLSKTWLQDSLNRFASQPFQLDQDVLARFRFVKISPEYSVLFFVVHHVVFDGWSAGVFLRELNDIYKSLRDGTEVPLAPNSENFRMHCLDQHRAFNSGEMDEALLYWYNRLFPAPAPIDLPYDFVVQSQRKKTGAVLRFAITSLQKKGLEQVATNLNVTPFVVYLSLYYLLLYRITKQEKLLVGVSVAHRSEMIHRNMIGPFAEVLPMISNIQPHISLAGFMQQVKDETGQDLEHSKIWLARLVEMVYPKGLPVPNTLFQVGFDFQNFPWPKAQGGNVSEGFSGEAKIDLNLGISSFEDSLICSLEYATDVFSEVTIKTFCDAFSHLIETVPTLDLTSRLIDIDIVSERQKDLITKLGDGPVVNHSAFVGAGVWLNAHSKNRPNQLAVEYKNESLTYSQLSLRVDALASYLEKLGIGRGDVVAFVFESCLDQVAILFGIWKAGACFLALDPNSGALRLSERIADIKPKAIVVTRALPEWLDKFPDLQVIAIDEVGTLEQPFTTEWTSLPDDPAYIVYTSGSTGPAKGVKISHHALTNFALGAQKQFGFEAHDRVLQFAPMFFDACYEEIMPALIAGATLVIRNPELMGSPKSFLKHMRDKKITIIDLPSSFWSELVPVWESAETDVRLVIIGGESIQTYHCVQWLDKNPAKNVRLINTYGVSEASVVSTYFELTHIKSEVLKNLPSVPVGRPFSNIKVRVVDQLSGHLALPEIYGEIWIGGLGVGESIDGKFTERFVCNSAGEAFYRTGDIGRMKIDGTIEVRGRIGSIAKIRGFLVNPSEIERAFGALSEVKACAVVIKEDKSSRQKILFAHLVSQNGAADTITVKSFANHELPGHLRPQQYIFHEQMPLTASGKIDKKILLDLSVQDQTSTELAQGQPLTFIEEVTAGIWRSVLGTADLGLYDDFFTIGGNSLLSIRVLAGIKETLKVDLNLVQFFDNPTVAALATLVELKFANLLLDPQSLQSQSVQSSNAYVLSAIEMYNISRLQHQVRPVAFEIEGNFNIPSWIKSVEQTIDGVECIRTKFHLLRKEATPVSSENFALDWSVQQFDSKSEVDAAMANEICEGIDLETEFPIKIRIYQTYDSRYYFLLMFHDASMDHKSIAQFMDEIFTEQRQSRLLAPDIIKNAKLQQKNYSAWSQKIYGQANSQNLPSLANIPEDIRERRRSTQKLIDFQNLEAIGDRLGVNTQLICTAISGTALTQNWPDKEFHLHWNLERRPMDGMQSCMGKFDLPCAFLMTRGEQESTTHVVKNLMAQTLSSYQSKVLPTNTPTAIDTYVSFDRFLVPKKVGGNISIKALSVVRAELPATIGFCFSQSREGLIVWCECDADFATDGELENALLHVVAAAAILNEESM